ncbi:MAG: 2-dehydro-3-deoxyglucarate aldolase [Polaromonas sp.]|nr:2-dehydro-3-deoxyglucarate aldolase [Polaromonas sp.]
MSAMLEKARKLKARWAAGEVTYGAWLAIGNPMVAEAMANAGFDWVFIDLEHTATDLGDLQTMLMAIAPSETVPIVRVPSADPFFIKRVLDIGAAGLMIPNVMDEAEALRIVAACKYPPQGIRGFGPWRASTYFRDLATYAERANEDLIIVMQIESVSALDHLDAILEIDGLDALCTGPADMAGSMGLFGKPTAAEVVRNLALIFEKARKKGIATAHGLIASQEDCRTLIDQGVQIIPIASDVGQLRQESAAKIAAYRQTGAPKVAQLY